MNIIFQAPHLNTIYAGRTIYAGYKHAFEDLGHNFCYFTSDDKQADLFDRIQPDIFITALNPYNLKYLDLEVLKKHKKRKLKVFVNLPYWKSPISKLRINETPNLSENAAYIELMRSGALGDIYYNVCESNDVRMDGFEQVTGYKHYTILLAADKTLHYPEFSDKFKADISYIGTYLPAKRKYFKQCVFPLKSKYDLKLYGQDWTVIDRTKGLAQKVGQYFNIPLLKSLQKPKLDLNDERKIYSSSMISINIHEDYQKYFGGDCNERTFKIPVCGGFEITDDVACIRNYFKDGVEIIIARSVDDWFDKIEYYLKNPEKRMPIIEAGRNKVLEQHTYHRRAEQIINIYESML